MIVSVQSWARAVGSRKPVKGPTGVSHLDSATPTQNILNKSKHTIILYYDYDNDTLHFVSG